MGERLGWLLSLDFRDVSLWPQRILLSALYVFLAVVIVAGLSMWYVALVDGVAAATGRRPSVTSPRAGFTATADPREPLRHTLLVGVAAGVVVVACCFVASLAHTVVGIALLAAVIPALMLAEAARWCVWFLVFRIRTRGRLPLRTGAFMHWAHETGLLRVSGHAYEFRHRELLDWLIAGAS
ncbi:hypothetical protein [Streptomyces sp. NPDC048385]|uniref:hypothetical protein n=1 Tax=unclassified Streptomyces TaxID=2593676 RepID=UPI00342BCC3A